MRESAGLKFIAGVLVFLFVLNDVGQAAPVLDLSAVFRSETPRVSHIDIPPEMATLEDWYESPAVGDNRLMLHIQDAHAQPEAQARTKDLIHYLNKQYGFKTVFVEGAAEPLDAKWLRPFDDAEKNKKWVEEKTASGEMSGVDLALLDGMAGLKALPIETIEGYRNGYQKLRAVYTSEAEVKSFLNFFESKLDAEASKILDDKTRAILSEWKKFESGHREFLPFVEKLAGLAKSDLKVDFNALYSQIEWPQLTRLLVLQRVEKEFEAKLEPGTRNQGKTTSESNDGQRLATSLRQQALIEKQKLVDLLRLKNAVQGVLQGLDRFDEKNLNLNRITVGDGRQFSSPRALIENLVEETRRLKIDLRDYPAFLKYAGYVILRGELNPSALFKEIEKLFEKILESSTSHPSTSLRTGEPQATKKDQVSSLVGLYRDSFLLKKLLNLELSRDEWKKAVERRFEIEPNFIMTRLKKIVLESSHESKSASPAQKSLSDIFANAFAFYDASIAREDIFFEKISNALVKNDKAILVTGGFHTEGMNEFFREKEISYGTLTPRITNLAPSSLYRNAMMRYASDSSSQPAPSLAQASSTIFAMVNANTGSRIAVEAKDLIGFVDALESIQDPNDAAELESVFVGHADLFAHRPQEFPDRPKRPTGVEIIPSRLIHQLDIEGARPFLVEKILGEPFDHEKLKDRPGYGAVTNLRDLFYFLMTKEHGRSLQLFADQYLRLNSAQRKVFLEQVFDIYQLIDTLRLLMNDDEYDASEEVLTAYGKAWPIVVEFGDQKNQSGGILRALLQVPELAKQFADRSESRVPPKEKPVNVIEEGKQFVDFLRKAPNFKGDATTQKALSEYLGGYLMIQKPLRNLADEAAWIRDEWQAFSLNYPQAEKYAQGTKVESNLINVAIAVLLEASKKDRSETRRPDSELPHSKSFFSPNRRTFLNLLMGGFFTSVAGNVVAQDQRAHLPGQQLVYGTGSWKVLAGDYKSTDTQKMAYEGKSLSEVKVVYDTRRGHAPQAISINANGAIRGHAVQKGRNDGMASTFYAMRYHDQNGKLHDNALISKIHSIKSELGKLILDVEMSDREVNGYIGWEASRAQITIYPPDTVDGTLRIDLEMEPDFREGFQFSEEKSRFFEAYQPYFVASNHSGVDKAFQDKEYWDATHVRFYNQSGGLVYERVLNEVLTEIPDTGFRMMTADGAAWEPLEKGGAAAFGVINTARSPAHELADMPIAPTILVVSHEGEFAAAGAVTYSGGVTDNNSDNVTATVHPQDISALMARPIKVSIFFMPGASAEAIDRIPNLIQSIRRSESRAPVEYSANGAIAFPIFLSLLGSFAVGTYIAMLATGFFGIVAALLVVLPVYAGARFFWRTVVEGKNFPFQSIQSAFLWEWKLLARILVKNVGEIISAWWWNRTMEQADLEYDFNVLRDSGLIDSNIGAHFHEDSKTGFTRFILWGTEDENGMEREYDSDEPLRIHRILADGENIYFEIIKAGKFFPAHEYQVVSQNNFSPQQNLSTADYRQAHRFVALAHRFVPAQFRDLSLEASLSPLRWSVYEAVLVGAFLLGVAGVAAEFIPASFWLRVEDAPQQFEAWLNAHSKREIAVTVFLAGAGGLIALLSGGNIVFQLVAGLITIFYKAVAGIAILGQRLIGLTRLPDLFYMLRSNFTGLSQDMLDRLTSTFRFIVEAEDETEYLGDDFSEQEDEFENETEFRGVISATERDLEIYLRQRMKSWLSGNGGDSRRVLYIGDRLEDVFTIADFNPESLMVVTQDDQTASIAEEFLIGETIGAGIWNRTKEKTVVVLNDNEHETLMQMAEQVEEQPFDLIVVHPNYKVGRTELALLFDHGQPATLLGPKRSLPNSFKGVIRRALNANLGSDSSQVKIDAGIVINGLIEVSTFGRSEVRVESESVVRLIQALKRYVPDLVEVDSLAENLPDLFLLAGNPNFKVFEQFVKVYKRDWLDKKIPIHVTGGIGRGTPDMLAWIQLHYPEKAQGFNSETPEAEILRFYLIEKGIPNDLITVEGNSPNTEANYLNSKDKISKIFEGKNIKGAPSIFIVTDPPLLKRAKLTADRVFNSESVVWNMRGMDLGKKVSFDFNALGRSAIRGNLSLEQLNELFQFAGYVAGFHDFILMGVSALGRFGEAKGIVDNIKNHSRFSEEEKEEKVFAVRNLVRNSQSVRDGLLAIYQSALRNEYGVSFVESKRSAEIIDQRFRSEIRTLNPQTDLIKPKLSFEEARRLVMRRTTGAEKGKLMAMVSNYRNPKLWELPSDKEREYATALSAMSLEALREHASDPDSPIKELIKTYSDFDEIVHLLTNISARRGGESLTLSHRWDDILNNTNPKPFQMPDSESEIFDVVTLGLHRAFIREIFYRWDTVEKPRSSDLFPARSEMRGEVDPEDYPLPKIKPVQDAAAKIFSTLYPNGAEGVRHLDLATGTGLVIQAGLEAGVEQAVGIDQSPQMLEVAKRFIVSDKVEWLDGDFQNIQFLAGQGKLMGQFNLVTMANVVDFYLPEEMRSVFFNIFNLLKSDGHLVLQLRSRDAMGRVGNLPARSSQEIRRGDEFVRGLYQGYIHVLETLGFEVEFKHATDEFDSDWGREYADLDMLVNQNYLLIARKKSRSEMRGVDEVVGGVALNREEIIRKFIAIIKGEDARDLKSNPFNLMSAGDKTLFFNDKKGFVQMTFWRYLFGKSGPQRVLGIGNNIVAVTLVAKKDIQNGYELDFKYEKENGEEGTFTGVFTKKGDRLGYEQKSLHVTQKGTIDRSERKYLQEDLPEVQQLKNILSSERPVSAAEPFNLMPVGNETLFINPLGGNVQSLFWKYLLGRSGRSSWLKIGENITVLLLIGKRNIENGYELDFKYEKENGEEGTFTGVFTQEGSALSYEQRFLDVTQKGTIKQLAQEFLPEVQQLKEILSGVRTVSAAEPFNLIPAGNETIFINPSLGYVKKIFWKYLFGGRGLQKRLEIGENITQLLLVGKRNVENGYELDFKYEKKNGEEGTFTAVFTKEADRLSYVQKSLHVTQKGTIDRSERKYLQEDLPEVQQLKDILSSVRPVSAAEPFDLMPAGNNNFFIQQRVGAIQATFWKYLFGKSGPTRALGIGKNIATLTLVAKKDIQNGYELDFKYEKENGEEGAFTGVFTKEGDRLSYVRKSLHVTQKGIQEDLPEVQQLKGILSGEQPVSAAEPFDLIPVGNETLFIQPQYGAIQLGFWKHLFGKVAPITKLRIGQDITELLLVGKRNIENGYELDFKYKKKNGDEGFFTGVFIQEGERLSYIRKDRKNIQEFKEILEDRQFASEAHPFDLMPESNQNLFIYPNTGQVKTTFWRYLFGESGPEVKLGVGGKVTALKLVGKRDIESGYELDFIGEREDGEQGYIKAYFLKDSQGKFVYKIVNNTFSPGSENSLKGQINERFQILLLRLLTKNHPSEKLIWAQKKEGTRLVAHPDSPQKMEVIPDALFTRQLIDIKWGRYIPNIRETIDKFYLASLLMENREKVDVVDESHPIFVFTLNEVPCCGETLTPHFRIIPIEAFLDPQSRDAEVLEARKFFGVSLEALEGEIYKQFKEFFGLLKQLLEANQEVEEDLLGLYASLADDVLPSAGGVIDEQKVSKKLEVLNGFLTETLGRSEMRDAPDWKALGVAENVKTLLYPAGGVDFSTGLSLARQLPNLTDIYYVDPNYSLSQERDPRLPLDYHYHLFEILTRFDEQGLITMTTAEVQKLLFESKFSESGKLTIPIKLKSLDRIVHLHLIQDEFNAQVADRKSLPSEYDFVLVKNPGTDHRLSQEAGYWNTVVEAVRGQGVVAVTLADVPAQGNEYADVRRQLGEPIYKSESFSGQGLVWADEWAIYRKQAGRSELQPLAESQSEVVAVSDEELRFNFDAAYNEMIRLLPQVNVQEAATVIAHFFVGLDLNAVQANAVLLHLVNNLGWGETLKLARELKTNHADIIEKLQGDAIVLDQITLDELKDPEFFSQTVDAVALALTVNPKMQFRFVTPAEREATDKYEEMIRLVEQKVKGGAVRQNLLYSTDSMEQVRFFIKQVVRSSAPLSASLSEELIRIVPHSLDRKHVKRAYDSTQRGLGVMTAGLLALDASGQMTDFFKEGDQFIISNDRLSRFDLRSEIRQMFEAVKAYATAA